MIYFMDCRDIFYGLLWYILWIAVIYFADVGEAVVDRPAFLDSLPQELGLDFTDVDVKIVRETKQRLAQNH